MTKRTVLADKSLASIWLKKHAYTLILYQAKLHVDRVWANKVFLCRRFIKPVCGTNTVAVKKKKKCEVLQRETQHLGQMPIAWQYVILSTTREIKALNRGII